MIIKPNDVDISEEQKKLIEGAFIEITDRWTKNETEACRRAKISEYFDEWIPKKVLSVHIPREGMDPITKVEDLTLDAMGDCDWAVYGFVMGALYTGLGKLFLSLQ